MNEREFMDLADLWKEPDAAEQALFEEIARKARRQARLLAFTDIAWVGLVVGSMVGGSFLKPGAGTAVIAALVIAMLLWLGWQRRRLRHMSRTLDTGDRESFIASAVTHARANLRRVTLSLWILPVVVPLAVLFKLSYRHGGRLDQGFAALGEWILSFRALITLAIVAAAVAALIRSSRKIKGELARLEALRQTYREEAVLDDRDDA